MKRLTLIRLLYMTKNSCLLSYMAGLSVQGRGKRKDQIFSRGCGKKILHRLEKRFAIYFYNTILAL